MLATCPRLLRPKLSRNRDSYQEPPGRCANALATQLDALDAVDDSNPIFSNGVQITNRAEQRFSKFGINCLSNMVDRSILQILWTGAILRERSVVVKH